MTNLKYQDGAQSAFGYSFMLRSANQTAIQIGRSYENDQSKNFRDRLLRDMKDNPAFLIHK